MHKYKSQNDVGCLSFVSLAMENGHRNRRLLIEWYRSLPRLQRAFRSDAELLAIYPNPK